MGEIMFGIVDTVKIFGSALVSFVAGAGLFYLIGHWQGEDAGREAARTEALQRSMELIRERSETNEAINALDDAGLCAALDGHWLRDEQRCE